MRVMLREALTSPLLAKVALAVYLAMLVFAIGFGYYLIPYVLFIIAFLFLVLNFSNFQFFKKVEANPLIQKVLLLFFLALFLRFALLFQEQIITRDIVMYVLRSERMMAGWIPYEDFAVNKPPLYAFMLQFLGSIIGAGEIQFRAFFSIMDAVVTVLVFYTLISKYNEEFSFKAAFAYAICPLPIIAIGLAGHYEPVVMIVVLLSLICLFKNKYSLSALLLGLGFALKFFPIVLLPFFMWKVRSWGGRISYIALFSIPMLLSIIPIFFMSPNAFYGYLYEQSLSWPAKKSFAFALEILTGSTNVFGIKFSLIFTLLFLGLIFLMFITWIRKKFDTTFWFKIIIISFAIYYGLFITASIKFYQTALGLNEPYSTMALFALIYFTIILFLFNRYWQKFELTTMKTEEMFVISAFSLIFLLFSSSQFNPWYFLWVLPFILGIKNERIRILLLWVIFWNLEGIGISLLPGLGLA